MIFLTYELKMSEVGLLLQETYMKICIYNDKIWVWSEHWNMEKLVPIIMTFSTFQYLNFSHEINANEQMWTVLDTYRDWKSNIIGQSVFFNTNAWSDKIIHG